MTITDCYSDDTKLRVLFSWLTRIGAGRKFGSLPIGWYQQHQCACIDWIAKHIGGKEMRCKSGNLQYKDNGKWHTAISTIELFQKADNQARGILTA